GARVRERTTLGGGRPIWAPARRALPQRVTGALADETNETPKPGDPIFANTSFVLATRPADVFRSVEGAVRAAGYECIVLGTAIEGEAREVAAAHGRLARDVARERRRARMRSRRWRGVA